MTSAQSTHSNRILPWTHNATGSLPSWVGPVSTKCWLQPYLLACKLLAPLQEGALLAGKAGVALRAAASQTVSAVDTVCAAMGSHVLAATMAVQAATMVTGCHVPALTQTAAGGGHPASAALRRLTTTDTRIARSTQSVAPTAAPAAEEDPMSKLLYSYS